jgi:hypothetical protein
LREATDKAHQKISIPGFTGWFLMYFAEKTGSRNRRGILAGIDNAKFSKFPWDD